MLVLRSVQCQALGMSQNQKVDLLASRLVEALKTHGEAHANRVYAQFIEVYRLTHAESLALRERFERLVSLV